MTKEEAAQNIKRFSDTLDTLSESLLIESLRMAIEALSATREWVPVSKRLPDKYDEYLCQDADGDRFVGWLEDKKWCKKHVAKEKIIAWMPLPERTKES